MYADFHTHTNFSSDSKASMESMIRAAIEKKLTHLCITEHLDYDYPINPAHPECDFLVNLDAYRKAFLSYREKYRNQITLLFGIELGLQPHLAPKFKKLVSDWPFDFVIGSCHLSEGADPYFPDYWNGKSEAVCIRRYFEYTLECLEAFHDIDTCAHLDYIVRYAPHTNENYTYEAYADILDKILLFLIEHDIALECNTGGLKYGLGEPNPSVGILKRYRDLGGTKITLGSDAHAPEHLAYDFPKAFEILKDCGFDSYTIFQKRRPQIIMPPPATYSF